VLNWDQYQKLLDEIGNLIGGGEQQDKAIEPPGDTAHIAIGIPVTTTDSTQEVKVLPKSSSLDLLTPLDNTAPIGYTDK
jgi:hypothetical protein